MDGKQFRSTIYAPAKINLFLHVIRKRDDGYHDLKTWMQKLDLYDIIELELYKGQGVELICEAPGVPTDVRNLVVRAVNSFFSVLPESRGYGAKLKLVKNIPVAAGLGGGSSDAGTVLRELNSIFDSRLSESELIDLARPLGADVPFFVTEHKSVLAEGVGDIMYPADSTKNVLFVLVNPDFFVSTAWVFQNLSLTRSSKHSTLPCFQKSEAHSLSLDDMHNDLELVTSARYKEIDEIKNDLLEAGAVKALMSGSGPTVFGVFPDEGSKEGPHLQNVIEQLRQKYGKKVFLSRACTGA